MGFQRDKGHWDEYRLLWYATWDEYPLLRLLTSTLWYGYSSQVDLLCYARFGFQWDNGSL